MTYFKNIILVFLIFFAAQPVFSTGASDKKAGAKLDVKELILSHLGDSYDWHITDTSDGGHVSIPLPVIVKGENSGWHIFMSSAFHHGTAPHNGFYIAQDGKYKGKVVEKNTSGEEIRPLDLSITKNAAGLIISSILLVSLILAVAKWYRKREKEKRHEAPSGFIGLMEMVIMSVNDDIIRPCVGKNYRKFAPYLLTVFFFIFFNNLLGLIPMFPFGANLTGNIAVTLVLSLFTFFIVNIFGTKEYWKEIFWPDVPMWLKIPPIMPAIELVGVFTKPFALMIRLFANIFAGHSIVLGLMCLIFVTAGSNAFMTGSMTFVSVFMTAFILVVELLVAYIQAYVFTMLSSVFIGLAQVEPHHSTAKN